MRAPENWLTLGRDGRQDYFSPLASIDKGNVGRLGFAWAYDLGTSRGQEATPIVVDGVMYTSGYVGIVYAIDAATGKEIWRFDPHVADAFIRNPCCDAVNRGVAVWQGRVYVASVDGRLHALDAATGKGDLGGRHLHRSRALVLQHRRSNRRPQRRRHWEQRR